MTNSDYIALAAVVIAFLSAYYARQSRDASRKANEIALLGHLRPQRLAVFQAMSRFSLYCSKYVTLYHMQEVKGTRDLVSQIDSFKWEIEQFGDLKMPSIDEKSKDFIKSAWQIQRLLDRMIGGQLRPLDSKYESAEENLDGIVEWFASENTNLKKHFEGFLSGS